VAQVEFTGAAECSIVAGLSQDISRKRVSSSASHQWDNSAYRVRKYRPALGWLTLKKFAIAIYVLDGPTRFRPWSQIATGIVLFICLFRNSPDTFATLWTRLSEAMICTICPPQFAKCRAVMTPSAPALPGVPKGNSGALRHRNHLRLEHHGIASGAGSRFPWERRRADDRLPAKYEEIYPVDAG